MPEGDVTLGSLIALGASGGLVPCPSALVLLLSSIALGRVGLGLLLLIAFSAGLALVLMGIGIVVLYAKHLLPDSQKTAAHPAFRIETHSVFEPLGEPADVIRTMNILNRYYFGEARLAQGVHAVFESLRNGGIWVAGRTDEKADPPVTATSILEKRDDRFAVVERIHGGWDLEAMAVTVR